MIIRSLTSLTPGNRNASSNNTAVCNYYYSTNITGITGGRQIGGLYGKEGEENEYLKPCSGWILPPNGTLIIKANNDTANHFGGLAFYYRDADD